MSDHGKHAQAEHAKADTLKAEASAHEAAARREHMKSGPGGVGKAILEKLGVEGIGTALGVGGVEILKGMLQKGGEVIVDKAQATLQQKIEEILALKRDDIDTLFHVTILKHPHGAEASKNLSERWTLRDRRAVKPYTKGRSEAEGGEERYEPMDEVDLIMFFAGRIEDKDDGKIDEQELIEITVEAGMTDIENFDRRMRNMRNDGVQRIGSQAWHKTKEMFGKLDTKLTAALNDPDHPIVQAAKTLSERANKARAKKGTGIVPGSSFISRLNDRLKQMAEELE